MIAADLHGRPASAPQPCGRGAVVFPELTDARRDRYHGHSSTHISRRYTHELPGQLAKDAQTIHDYLTGANAGASTIDAELEPAPLSHN